MKVIYKETVEDLQKKYHRSYVHYDGQVVYVHALEHATGDNPHDCLMTYYAASQPKVSKAEVIDPTKFEAFTFDAMFFNNGKLDGSCIPATHFSRSPRRQWKRGLTVENTRLVTPLRALYKSFGKTVRDFDEKIGFDVIKRLQAPTYPTLEQALAVVEKAQGVAISPMFAITLSNQSKDSCLLASAFGFIGEVKRGAITVKHKPALQEVRDFVSRSGQPIMVELNA